MSELLPEDRRWLDAAVRYATPFQGTTAENPAVAALVVSPARRTVLARAVTGRGGRPHAAAEAIAAAGFDAAGSTLYLTLEPCNHWGRTPPCVAAIIRSGIMRVVIGVTDPDPRTAGASLAQLESAGIETILADHAPSKALHAGHIMRHTADRPHVTAMLAMSSDGMIGRAGEGYERHVGPAAKQWMDMLRARADAVMVGGATARMDDPALAVTLPGLGAETPLRVVLAGAAGIDRKVNLIGGFSGYRTAIIAETSVSIDAPVSIEVMRVAGADGRPDLGEAMKTLAKKGIQNLLVEPGQRLATALLDAGLVDRFVLLTGTGVLGPEAVPVCPEGTFTDVLAASGFIGHEREALGGDNLMIYERAARPH